MDPNILFSYYQKNNSENHNDDDLKNSASAQDIGSQNVVPNDDDTVNGDHNDNDSDYKYDSDLDDEELEGLYDDDDDDNDHHGHHHHDDEAGFVENLPEHACAYCGIHNSSSVVKCNTCNKWFCNSKNNTSSSHIITHLVMSKHNVVSLHPDSDLGDTTLECYNCGNKNVFVLGFVSAKSETVIVILCRLPCSQQKDSRWDTNEWTSLIEDRQLLSWVANIPTEEDTLNARIITNSQISKLEAKWRLNKDATIQDVEKPEEENEIVPILMRYTDAYEYQRSFGPLVKLEADYDKQLKESQALEHISVKWSLALNNKHLASFTLSTFESSELKVAVGDEMILRYSGINHEAWEAKGFIIRIPSAHQEEFTLELSTNHKNPPPTQCTTDFTAEFVWKGTSYDRMQNAMKSFATDQLSVSGYIYHKLLGHEVNEVEFDIKLPSKFSIPGFAELNVSQASAVKNVLQKPLSLIQGPPGTGKTVTSATIIHHLTNLNKDRILVCAPSNVAVDHLASKLDQLGLKVIRLTAKSREDVESSVQHLSLSNIIQKSAKGQLKKLLRLRNELGELSAEDTKTYFTLLRKKEKSILKQADVVCATCVGAGDRRLENVNFRTILIDESTQASEPECLIPLVHGAKQVILVGDHQQLGPVILDKKAGDAGLKQSLFERLVVLGHVPIRLEVQYRMNPCLSEFSSNMFYDGSLQNGVTKEQRQLPNSAFPWPVVDTPMMFWANFGREEISGSGTSFLNRIEAMNCERIITRLFRDGVQPEQIGVITPYEGQRAYVVQYMQMNGSMDKDLYMDVEVASVDAFQGREKDFIILSCVRANDQQNIGFLSDPRRLNVALTRAKYGVVILGNPRALSKNQLWNQLLLHYREKGCLVEGLLDSLQLSSVQLNRPNNRFKPNRGRQNFGGEAYHKFGAPTTNAGSTINDFETASLVSFATDNESVGFTSNAGFPPFFSAKQWPTFNDQYQSNGNDANESENATNGNTYDPATNPQIGSSFSSRLEKLGGSSSRYDNQNIEDDIRSITSGFGPSGLNLNGR
ncbi:ATP-dependent helicase NAM7 [Wickerhamomyces ciferrii]|uniref:ATP-dependent helicase NAM7 n=1 Tax=Wickerhamomyces ciferrii (strain ATCC 14091 / BCRC 22168 / CBS 111 / JCM 3599 / NBRC 0793 / NRRL Y-1031 F-60-10) TaxID=1206466 RepID=K0KIK8_WICCF|nr:ATP-dependent helicase NAM7 [Wickerhamomyces ciferrii]CCH41224.1 ATP-dependent helicase NAM7 [Wickerhamomyces ciferrii]